MQWVIEAEQLAERLDYRWRCIPSSDDSILMSDASDCIKTLLSKYDEMSEEAKLATDILEDLQFALAAYFGALDFGDPPTRRRALKTLRKVHDAYDVYENLGHC